MIMIWDSIYGQTSNQTSEEYEYIDEIEKPVYYNPVINVKVEMPTPRTQEYEYVEELDTKLSTISSTEPSTEAPDCGHICEPKIFDSISGLTSHSSKELVILFREHCFWIIDIKKELNKSHYGKEHPFLFEQIEGSFATPIADNEFNVTAIFTSGLSSQSFLFKDLSQTQLVKTIQPFPGLTASTRFPIDDTFIWLNSQTIYFFQKSHYFAYDLLNKREFSGYPRNLTDFWFELNH